MQFRSLYQEIPVHRFPLIFLQTSYVLLVLYSSFLFLFLFYLYYHFLFHCYSYFHAIQHVHRAMPPILVHLFHSCLNPLPVVILSFKFRSLNYQLLSAILNYIIEYVLGVLLELRRLCLTLIT